MTLITAIKFEDGVVIATDSLVLYGDAPLSREEAPKVERFGSFAITGAGLAGPLEKIMNEIKSSSKMGAVSTFDDLIDLCEEIVWNYYQKYAERIFESEEDKSGWTILLISKNRICRVMTKGWAEEERKYAAEGSGNLYAEYIFKQRYKINMHEEEAKKLAVFAMNETSRIDPSVGGKICLFVIDVLGMKYIDDEEVNGILSSVTGGSIETEKEIQTVVHKIVEKRRWVNTLFNQKYGGDLFGQNEFAISEIQKGCENENDFTNRISALSLLIDSIEVKNLKKHITTDKFGSINILEEFLNSKHTDYDSNITINMRDIMTLRSKKMPIHDDDPKIIQVLLKWEPTFPPNWSSIWKKALSKYFEVLTKLEILLS